MTPTKQQIERAAAAIANARVMRRGSPPISNVLAILPPKLHTEVMEDAEAALKSVSDYSDYARETAEIIAADIFKSGDGVEANRLVLEQREKLKGPGWGKFVIVDRVERILRGERP